MLCWDFNGDSVLLLPGWCLEYGPKEDTPLVHAPPTHVTARGSHHLVGGAWVDRDENRLGSGQRDTWERKGLKMKLGGDRCV